MRFILRRLGFFILTLWAAVTLNFFLPRLMPGNPALAMLAKFRGPVNPSALKALEVAFGVKTHQSLISQYVGYLGDIATGKFGTSLYFYPESVGRVILDAIPWTLGLVGVTTILAFLLGTGVGIVAAWRRGGAMDSILPPTFVITSAIPYFWIGLMLILIFSEKLTWFPSSNGYDVTLIPSATGSFVGNVLWHAILPAAALLITTIGTWVLTMRNTMVTTLAEDYVRMARAKGLPGRRIMFDYAARNASCPTSPGSPCRWASWSAVRSWWSTSSTTRVWATCCSRP